MSAARNLFAERGYAAVTNKDLCSEAGITTGALYHYVESKLDLYVAVENDVQEQIYARFQAAVGSSDTFLGKLTAVLDAANEMGEHDRTLAMFVGTVRSDIRRHPEIAERLSKHARRREQFFLAIVDTGVATGEIEPQNRKLVNEFVKTVLVGLTEINDRNGTERKAAFEAVKAVLRGELIAPLVADSKAS